jgi:hypothetical protein
MRSPGLDAFIADQSPSPSRPEAILTILTDYLREKGYLK